MRLISNYLKFISLFKVTLYFNRIKKMIKFMYFTLIYNVFI